MPEPGSRADIPGCGGLQHQGPERDHAERGREERSLQGREPGPLSRQQALDLQPLGAAGLSDQRLRERLGRQRSLGRDLLLRPTTGRGGKAQEAHGAPDPDPGRRLRGGRSKPRAIPSFRHDDAAPREPGCRGAQLRFQRYGGRRRAEGQPEQLHHEVPAV